MDREAELRQAVGSAIIQSGYEDQDFDDPQSWDLLQWHPCEDTCRKCGCAGVPWISDQLWPFLKAVIEDYAAKERAQACEEAAEEIAEQILEMDRHVDATALDFATTARAIGQGKKANR